MSDEQPSQHPSSDTQALIERVARLEATVLALQARLVELEKRPADAGTVGVALPKPMRAPAVLTAEADVVPAEASPSPPVEPTSPVPTSRALPPAPDWERLIGGRWALWVGALAIFLAVSFFLALSWQNIPPVGRVVGGFGLGVGLLAAAAWLRTRAEPWFAEGLAGVGLGLFYLNLWAAHHSHALLGVGVTYAGLLAVTALGVAIALRYEARSQIGMATAGGFLTPVVLAGFSSAELGLALYALILDVGLLAVSTYRRSPHMAWWCLVGTLVIWPYDVGSAQLWPTFALTTATFAAFAGAAVGYSLRKRENTLPHDVLLLLAATFLYAPFGYFWIQGELGQAGAVFPLALAVAFFGIAISTRRFVPENRGFYAGAISLAIFGVTLAIPIQLYLLEWSDGKGILAVAWVVEAALLSGLGLHFKDRIYRVLSAVVGLFSGVLTGVMAVMFSVGYGVQPGPISSGSLPLLVALVGAVALGALAHHHRVRTGLAAWVAGFAAWGLAWVELSRQTMGPTAWWPEAEVLLPTCGLAALAAAALFALGRLWNDPDFRGGALLTWALCAAWVLVRTPFAIGDAHVIFRPAGELGALAGGLAMAFLARKLQAHDAERQAIAYLPLALFVLVVFTLSVETYDLVRTWHAPNWEVQAQLGISLAWIVSAVAGLVGGIRFALRPFRLFGLGLLGLSVCKVFLFDLAFLDTVYRVAALGGLGAALIGISWLYGRYGVGGEMGRGAPDQGGQ